LTGKELPNKSFDLAMLLPLDWIWENTSTDLTGWRELCNSPKVSKSQSTKQDYICLQEDSGTKEPQI
jgi:hypothetical protein